MSNSINTNISAYYAQGNISAASQLASASVQRLSSGNRIVQASDDVAGLAIGSTLQTQVGILQTAKLNAAQGTSLLQVADGALGQIQSILQQMESVANQAQSGSLTNTDRGFLDQEFQALSSQINNLATGTTFNGVQLIDGSIATGGSTNPLRTEVKGGASTADPDPTTSATVTGQTTQGAVSSTAATLTNDDKSSNDLNDTTFQGALSGGVFSVSWDGVKGYGVSYNLNGVTYSAAMNDITSEGSLLSLDSGTGTIAITLTGGDLTAITSAAGGVVYAKSAAGALNFQKDLQANFAGATAYALHSIKSDALALDANGNSIAGTAIRTVDTAGTILDHFTGDNVNISGTGFTTGVFATGTGQALPPISTFSASGTGTSTVFSVLVNGVTYKTQGALTMDGTSSIKGSTFNGSAGLNSGVGVLTFYKNGDLTNNPNQFVQLDLEALTSTDAKIATTAEVTSFTNALNTLFGTGGSAGGLSFQLGATSTSNVAVTIANSQTTALFSGATLDTKTASDAATAAAAVSTALNTITATRSGVGALQSQFGYAAAAVQSGIQTQSAAQSQFLDTDIAAESTNFATEQVKLQAGISVLAQANQQLQALLKLIG